MSQGQLRKPASFPLSYHEVASQHAEPALSPNFPFGCPRIGLFADHFFCRGAAPVLIKVRAHQLLLTCPVRICPASVFGAPFSVDGTRTSNSKRLMSGRKFPDTRPPNSCELAENRTQRRFCKPKAYGP